MPLETLSQIKKSLWRLNWLVAIIISLLVFLFGSLNNFGSLRNTTSVAFSLITAVNLFLIGTCHTLIFTHYARRGLTGSPAYKVQRYFASYCYSAILYLAKVYSYDVLSAKITWEFSNLLLLFMLFIISCAINTLVIILHDFVILLHRKTQTEIENMQLKNAVSEASNLMLKQQIHPHFLFNSLNTLKVLYEVDMAQGKSYLMHLAAYLRATISDHHQNITKLSSELQLCRNYMEMQRMRFGDILQYHVSVSKEAQNAFVPFFSLQPLLENAIKHNRLTESSPMHIWLTQEGEWVTVTNNLQPKRHKEASTGQGLLNLAQRYRLWTGDEIKIKDNGKEFTVSIKLKYDGDSNYRG